MVFNKHIFFLFLLIALSVDCLHVRAYAQQYDMHMSLNDVIETAQEQSPASFLAKHNFLVNYWEYRTYKAELLPSLNFSGTLLEYNRSFTALQNSETGAFNYVNNNVLTNTLYLSIDQNITLTGGTISILSSLSRLDQFPPNRNLTYNSSPIYLMLSQPINGYNAFKWEKKIEPKKYELAKYEYLEAMETITITSVGYFFDLFIAQRKLEMAITGRENTLQLYEIAKERFKIGTITHDELLQLNLRLINDDLSISDCRVSEQIAMMKLRTYLGYNESITITLSIPPDNHDLILPLNDVMQKAFDNSTVVLDNEINLLYAKQEVAQAKASARFSANISLQFGLNQIGRNLPEAYRSPLDQEIVGLTLSGPILNWGLGKGKVKVAKSQAEVIASQIEQTVNSLQEIITLKVMQFNLQSSQCDVSRLGDEVGRNRYASTRERFVNGTVGVTDLIMAQSEMDAASLRYFQNLSNWWQYYYSIRQITLFDYLEERKIDADFDKLIGERIL